MNNLATALGPVFATGFAVQQLLELIDPLLSAIAKTPMNKKIVMGIISLAIGLLLAKFGGFHVLADLSTASGGKWDHPALDFFVTGLILSAGTEGFNSIMKFIGYAKENKKAQAASEKSTAPPAALKSLNRTAGA